MAKWMVYTLPALAFVFYQNALMGTAAGPFGVLLPIIALAAVFYEFYRENGLRSGVKAVLISLAVMAFFVLDAVLASLVAV